MSGERSSPGRGRRAVVVVVAALAVLAVVLALPFVPRARTERAQITGYSRESPTVLAVAFVRGQDESLARAYAVETPDRVVLHVEVANPGHWWWQSSAADAVVDATTVALSSPLGERSVVDDRGDAVVEQAPGVIRAPS